jgi:hypothetical protein
LWIPGIKRSAKGWIDEDTEGIIQITVAKVL